MYKPLFFARIGCRNKTRHTFKYKQLPNKSFHVFFASSAKRRLTYNLSIDTQSFIPFKYVSISFTRRLCPKRAFACIVSARVAHRICLAYAAFQSICLSMLNCTLHGIRVFMNSLILLLRKPPTLCVLWIPDACVWVVLFIAFFSGRKLGAWWCC